MPFTDRQKQRDSQRKWIKANRPYVYEFRRKRHAAVIGLKNQPCADCGGRFHHAAMDFDHRLGEQKLFNIAEAHRLGYSWKRILAEVAKCEVVCANCHRVRTYDRMTRGGLEPGPSTAS